MPNLFLASVHFLLLNNPEEKLSQYYPSLTKNFKQNLPFEQFKEFCLNHQEEIKEIEQTKIVQTNALNRTAYLMPVLSHLFDGKTINIIDIGTSAGLTMNMDKYEYHYNTKHSFGDSSVKIRSEIKNGNSPKFDKPVKIRNKIGIDRNPLDLKIMSNENWLKALIWADNTERLEKMEEAITLAKQTEFDFRKASDLETFYKNGSKNNRIVAETNGHANWIKWKNENFA